MFRRVAASVGVIVLLAVLYLSLWPTRVDPKAWQPKPAPPLVGEYAVNDKLKESEWLFRDWAGPEAITFDAEGKLLTGLADGRVVRATLATGEVEVLTNTLGRPLGLKYHPDGRLYICDALKGLLALEPNGQVVTLAESEGGQRFGFTDDLTIAADGTVYFTDASTRFSLHEYKLDIIEHQTTGRVLKYEPAAKRISKVVDGLQFANGIALGPDESWLLVAETGEYRVQRVYVSGPQAGQKEVFVDNLPGFPDNVTYSPPRGIFWVAIGSPRDPIVDMLGNQLFLRKAIARLPDALQPAPKPHAMVLGFDAQGHVKHNFQYVALDSYFPVSSVIEQAGSLYLGSFSRNGIARFRL